MGIRSLGLATLLAVALLLITSSSALAGVEDNPNVSVATDLACANGFTSDELLIVGRTGHVASGFAGVAKSVWVLNVAPQPVPVFDVPGRGLDKLTVWCEWSSGPLRFGGDILLPGNDR